jgi:hypothetical protein
MCVRSIKLSRQVCETQMPALTVLNVVCKTQFKMTDAISSKEFCDEYDPTFFHLWREEHQHAMGIVARLRKQKWGSNKEALETHCLTLVCAPPKAHPRFLPCRLLIRWMPLFVEDYCSELNIKSIIVGIIYEKLVYQMINIRDNSISYI